MKSEIRNPKSERRPKSEIRKVGRLARPFGRLTDTAFVDSGLRAYASLLTPPGSAIPGGTFAGFAHFTAYA